MELRDATAERVRAYWSAWAAATVLTDRVSIVVIGSDRFMCAPDHLRAASDPSEWSEAGVDEACDFRGGIVDGDALIAGAGMHVWADAFGHIGVFTATAARGRGLAAQIGTAAIADVFTRGLVPQWRSRFGNDASTRVGDRLGFVERGRQATVRVRARP